MADNNTFDAIVVGSGISGGWAAKELCEKGLKVLMLERGHHIEHIKDYADTTNQFGSIRIVQSYTENVEGLPCFKKRIIPLMNVIFHTGPLTKILLMLKRNHWLVSRISYRRKIINVGKTKLSLVPEQGF
jgi:choline dehydrogenase-like flavoprotein